jgi:hypothetical protein
MPTDSDPSPILQYLGMALGVGIVLLAVYFAMRRGRSIFLGASGEFLCDSCKYNNERYCSQPDRPNAKKCADYKSVL